MALGEVVRQRTEPPCTEAAEVSASGPHTVPLNTLKIDGNEIGLLGGLWLLRGLAATESQVMQGPRMNGEGDVASGNCV